MSPTLADRRDAEKRIMAEARTITRGMRTIRPDDLRAAARRLGLEEYVAGMVKR